MVQTTITTCMEFVYLESHVCSKVYEWVGGIQLQLGKLTHILSFSLFYRNAAALLFPPPLSHLDFLPPRPPLLPHTLTSPSPFPPHSPLIHLLSTHQTSLSLPLLIPHPYQGTQVENHQVRKFRVCQMTLLFLHTVYHLAKDLSSLSSLPTPRPRCNRGFSPEWAPVDYCSNCDCYHCHDKVWDLTTCQLALLDPILALIIAKQQCVLPGQFNVVKICSSTSFVCFSLQTIPAAFISLCPLITKLFNRGFQVVVLCGSVAMTTQYNFRYHTKQELIWKLQHQHDRPALRSKFIEILSVQTSRLFLHHNLGNMMQAINSEYV